MDNTGQDVDVFVNSFQKSYLLTDEDGYLEVTIFFNKDETELLVEAEKAFFLPVIEQKTVSINTDETAHVDYTLYRSVTSMNHKYIIAEEGGEIIIKDYNDKEIGRLYIPPNCLPYDMTITAEILSSPTFDSNAQMPVRIISNWFILQPELEFGESKPVLTIKKDSRLIPAGLDENYIYSMGFTKVNSANCLYIDPFDNYFWYQKLDVDDISNDSFNITLDHFSNGVVVTHNDEPSAKDVFDRKLKQYASCLSDGAYAGKLSSAYNTIEDCAVPIANFIHETLNFLQCTSQNILLSNMITNVLSDELVKDLKDLLSIDFDAELDPIPDTHPDGGSPEDSVRGLIWLIENSGSGESNMSDKYTDLYNSALHRVDGIVENIKGLANYALSTTDTFKLNGKNEPKITPREKIINELVKNGTTEEDLQDFEFVAETACYQPDSYVEFPAAILMQEECTQYFINWGNEGGTVFEGEVVFEWEDFFPNMSIIDLEIIHNILLELKDFLLTDYEDWAKDWLKTKESLIDEYLINYFPDCAGTLKFDLQNIRLMDLNNNLLNTSINIGDSENPPPNNPLNQINEDFYIVGNVEYPGSQLFESRVCAWDVTDIIKNSHVTGDNFLTTILFNKGNESIVLYDEIADLLAELIDTYFGMEMDKTDTDFMDAVNTLVEKINSSAETKVSINLEEIFQILKIHLGLSLSDYYEGNLALGKLIALPYVLNGRLLSSDVTDNQFELLMTTDKFPTKSDGNLSEYKFAVSAFWELPIEADSTAMDLFIKYGGSGTLGFDFSGSTAILFTIKSASSFDQSFLQTHCPYEGVTIDRLLQRSRVYRIKWTNYSVYHDGDVSGGGEGEFKFHGLYDIEHAIHTRINLLSCDNLASRFYNECIYYISYEMPRYDDYGLSSDWISRSVMKTNELSIDSFTLNASFDDIPSSYYLNGMENIVYITVPLMEENTEIGVKTIDISLRICEYDSYSADCDLKTITFNPNLPTDPETGLIAAFSSIEEYSAALRQDMSSLKNLILQLRGEDTFLYDGFEMDVWFDIDCLYDYANGIRLNDGSFDGTCTTRDFTTDYDYFGLFDKYLFDTLSGFNLKAYVNAYRDCLIDPNVDVNNDDEMSACIADRLSQTQ